MRKRVDSLTKQGLRHVQRQKSLERTLKHYRKRGKRFTLSRFEHERKLREQGKADWCQQARKRLYSHPALAAKHMAWLVRVGANPTVYECAHVREPRHWHVTSNMKRRKFSES